MMSIATITRMSREQASLARSSGAEPQRFNFHDIKTFPPFHLSLSLSLSLATTFPMNSPLSWMRTGMRSPFSVIVQE